MKAATLVTLFSLSLTGSLAAQERELSLLVGPAAKAAPSTQPPMRLAETLEVGALNALPEASVGAGDALASLDAWNRSRQLPVRNGIARPLPSSLKADLALSPALAKRKSGGGWLAADLQGRAVWGTSVHVAQSHRLRLELRDVRLPAGSQLWVWSESGEMVSFDTSLRSEDGTLWTPSVAGPTVYLEVATPAGSAPPAGAAFSVERVLQLFPLAQNGEALLGPAPATKEETDCLIDAACISNGTLSGIANLKKAVAYLEFVSGGIGFICSGGLLNNTLNDFTPYFLTAAHCFDTQGEVNTLEAFFDFIDSSCNGSAPGLGTLPRSVGGTLLATSGNSDFTFVRLSSAPGSRTFLGWNSNVSATAAGTALYRLSHPLGLPMGYSKAVAWNPPLTCSGVPTSRFLYDDPQPEMGNGATFGGSSGSLALLANGQVVGQLTGACGPNAAEPCLAGSLDSDLDGRFSQTFSSISSFLSPVGDTTPCVQSATTACLQSGRFEVKVDFQSAASSGAAQVMGFGGQRAENNESAFFWFFSSTNFEMGLKVLNGCGVNNKFWVFISGLTDQGWTVRVRDTTNGATKTYSNTLGHLTSTTADISALSCP